MSAYHDRKKRNYRPATAPRPLPEAVSKRRQQLQFLEPIAQWRQALGLDDREIAALIAGRRGHPVSRREVRALVAEALEVFGSSIKRPGARGGNPRTPYTRSSAGAGSAAHPEPNYVSKLLQSERAGPKGRTHEPTADEQCAEGDRGSLPSNHASDSERGVA